MVPNRSYSFPYLSIARHYGVEYGEVLKVADTFTRGGDVWHRRTPRVLSNACLADIVDEARWQQRISNGEVKFDA